ncbi:MAG: DNA translocase FtsK [Pirellulaceae bacterium]|nr:DNA translocase FtsK [Pirellulaceae bacterium]
MLDHRNVRRDLAALGLGALVVFLAAALASYDPADPLPRPLAPLSFIYQPDSLVHPPHTAATNWCGAWGALAADGLLTLLGLGAYYFVVSLAVLDWQLLRRNEIDMPAMRALGWIASLLGATTIAAIALPSYSPGPVIGSGGYLGALGRGVAQMHFAAAGSLIIASSVTLGGLLLATDYALIRGMIFVVQFVRRPAGAAGAPVAVAGVAAKATSSKRSRSDLDHDGLPDLSGVPVKMRGKTSEPAALPTESAPRPAAARTTTEEDQTVQLKVVTPADKKVAATSVTETITRQDSAASPLRVKSPSDRKQEAAAREREELMRRMSEASPVTDDEYELPSIELLLPSDDVNFEAQATEVRRKAKILEKTFLDFGFTVKVVEIETGPVIAQYEVELEAGLRLSKITGLADDLAIALRVPSVRIVAPIPGKNTVGIEVPNEQRQVVRLREVIEEANGKTKKMRIPLFLGKDVSGNALTVDLSTLPHLLIAGRTGTGKSVCLNAIISSILMTRRPDEVRMLMIDPKMVELSGYARLPHLMHPVVTDMRKAEAILAWAVEKMEERYALLARAGVRHISSYNQLGEEELMERLQPENDEERASIPQQLPFIVIVADEMADLMMTSGKEVEQHIIRLAQKSRAVGIHLILATQKPTVDVITGLIKSNLPARIAFQVASRTDSRVVLDEMGADKLLGNGDMLFLWPGTSTLLRGQGTYLSDEEINHIVDCCSRGEQHFVQELVNIQVKDPAGEESAAKPGGGLQKRDELYESAVDLVVREGRGSVSLLQRALGIGYGRAARLIDFMAEDGIVGQYNGSQAREILISPADWERMQGYNAAEDDPPAASAGRASGGSASAPPGKRNRILPEPWPEDPADDDVRSRHEADEESDEMTDDSGDEEDARPRYQAESA